MPYKRTQNQILMAALTSQRPVIRNENFVRNVHIFAPDPKVGRGRQQAISRYFAAQATARTRSNRLWPRTELTAPAVE